MVDDEAKIIIGTSPVAADRRHAYLLFERSDGSQLVVRAGPDARTEGSQIGNLAESTLLGSKNFGDIRVDIAPYHAPYDAVYQQQTDGTVRPIPVGMEQYDDPTLLRDEKGAPTRGRMMAPDWPQSGETHERRVVWSGTDAELDDKLKSVMMVGQQINDAKLEYSPLNNNSNGVASALLEVAHIAPVLPLDKDGKPVNAPNFGGNLYQNIGIMSMRSGYSFDGKQWKDSDGRAIKPPHAGQPVELININEKDNARTGGFNEKGDIHIDDSSAREGLHNPRCRAR
ncbi:hypothetical protein [Ottowia sp.]|uniref:hypothetical protein n=1 Tax=Ottowia sp. TaxID=1898956 RepID=UPI003A8BC4B6